MYIVFSFHFIRPHAHLIQYYTIAFEIPRNSIFHRTNVRALNYTLCAFKLLKIDQSTKLAEKLRKKRRRIKNNSTKRQITKNIILFKWIIWRSMQRSVCVQFSGVVMHVIFLYVWNIGFYHWWFVIGSVRITNFCFQHGLNATAYVSSDAQKVSLYVSPAGKTISRTQLSRSRINCYFILFN